MTFKVLEVDLDQDFDELFAVEWTAWMNPPQALWELMFPVVGDGPDAEAAAIRDGAARQLLASKGDPHDRWVKVVDTDTNKIVAGALWKFYDTNPYRAPLDDFDAVWCPPGELKELCNQMYTQLQAWRPKTMAVAHACKCHLSCHKTHLLVQYRLIYFPVLNILFTHPEHRNKGAAGLLVEWGTQQADKLGIEAYVEGTYLGRKVYEKYGFVMMHMAEMVFLESNESPGQKWRHMVKDMQNNPTAIMWRPAGGKYVKGETVVPWEGTPRKD